MTEGELLQVLTKAARSKRLELDLAHCELNSLPSEIGELTNLQRLYLMDNNLKALPKEVGLLSNLRTLDLRHNQLGTLPSEIGKLVNLRNLYLRSNQLTTLVPEIGDLRNLKDLLLRDNKLSSLPAEIGRLTKLEVMTLEDNPLNSPPPEIMDHGMRAILAYLRGRLQHTSKQWVSKLLVVGEGGVGKTSMLRALRGEGFDTQESTTHGIEIQPMYFQHPKERSANMQLNTWDFGGQEIYHATHQFFLTNRSLFVLVWNARLGFEQGKLYYWLDTIKARAPESPVIIAATFIDERDANIPLANMRQKYPQIVAHCEISNRTRIGLEELRRVIAKTAACLPLMGENWPTDWLKASNAIRDKAKKEKYITPQGLWGVMARHNVTGTPAEVLAQWLHELGDILYFSDDEELSDTVILNPQWVTESISKVLESKEVIENLGLFTRKHMNVLWSDIDPAMRDHFLRLMEKFDLSYRTLENRDISLVVERLNLDPPEYEAAWSECLRDSSREISMKLALDTTMPAGVPTWFIARSHRFTTRTHWRYGALFADGPERKHLGLIQAFPHDRYLKLTVRGSTPHNFFSLLLDGLEVTLRRFPGMKIDRKIPCPGHASECCMHEFDLLHVQKAIERKPPILEIQCPIALENVSVPSLLVGLPWSMPNEVVAEQYRNILTRMESMHEGMDELRQLTQREFVKIFHREQTTAETCCPNIFVLKPSDSNLWQSVINQKISLQLYCQAPGQWHPSTVNASRPSEEAGLYQMRSPAEWIYTLAPYLRRMVQVLKFSTPVVGPWIGILSQEHYKMIFEKDTELMVELVQRLPEAKEQKRDGPDEAKQSASPEHAEGGSLRNLRKLLDERDPHHTWGGLRRMLTPEGHYLWLCQYHAAEYDR